MTALASIDCASREVRRWEKNPHGPLRVTHLADLTPETDLQSLREFVLYPHTFFREPEPSYGY